MIRFRIEDAASVRQLEVNLDEITIGRAKGCVIAIGDPGVGRFHASLHREGTRLRLVTTGRGAGTWLNGAPVAERAELRVGDRLTVGRTHLVLEAFLPGARVARAPDGPAHEPPPPPPPDTALGDLPPTAGGSSKSVRSLLEKSGLVRPRPSGTPPAAPPPPSPAPSSPPSPVGSESIGFSTEMLRAPAGGGLEEARALHRILAINKRLAREHDEARLLDRILDAAVDLTGAARGVLVEPSPDGPDAPPAPRVGRGGLECVRGDWSAVAVRVLAEGRSVRVEGADGRATLGVPLRTDAGPLGALVLDRDPGAGPFDARSGALLEAFADQASLALRTARLVRENRTAREDVEAARDRLAEANARLEAALRERTVELEDAREAAARARRERPLKYAYDRIIGRSAPVRTLLALVDKVTASSVPVLIEGESGTGKELVARAIHHNGPRGQRPFVVENCAAVPDALIENELFGHERGAFTGADRAQEGLFERADGGTIFLDEVGDMSPEMQKKVLRVLQEGEVRRVGGEDMRRVDVRVLCATNRDLVRMVRDGRFREDLFYRLCVVRVRIPALRERRDDVPLLAAHFLDRLAKEIEGGAPRLEADALDALTAYSWPGNVRELENEIRRAATLADAGTIGLDILSSHVREAVAATAAAGGPLLEVPVGAGGAGGPGGSATGRTIKEAVGALERAMIVQALRDTNGNKTHAARALGLSRLGLRKKMARHGIDG